MNSTPEDIHHMERFINYILWRDYRYLQQADKEDIAQDVYLYILKNNKEVTLWYLAQLVKGRAINCIRGRSKAPISLTEADSLTCEPVETNSIVDELQLNLTEEEHRLLNYLWEGYTQREIAEKLGLTQQAVSLQVIQLQHKTKDLLSQ